MPETPYTGQRDRDSYDQLAKARRVLLVDENGNVIAELPIGGNVGLLSVGDVRINPATEDGNLALIKAKTDNLDLALTALRDALRGGSNKTLSDLDTLLGSIKTAVEILDNIVSGSEAQVDVLTQPARSRTVDAVAAALQTDALMTGLTALTPKFKSISIAASADLIAAVTSKKIRIVAGFLTVAADTTIKFQSGGSTDLTGAMTVKSGGGFVLPFNPVGYFESTSGAKLNAVLGTATQVSGSLTYIEV